LKNTVAGFIVGVRNGENRAMNDQLDTLDPTDEDILSCTVSDEALEAAAGTERGALLLNRARWTANTISDEALEAAAGTEKAPTAGTLHWTLVPCC
jgi:hypothetical protein